MDLEELSAAVRELQDRQAIHDCILRYSRGVDRLDRELLLSVYHPDAVDDHGMFVGGPEEFADWALDMHRSTHLSQQHCIFNHSCDLDGDVAHTETYYMFVGMNRTGAPFVVSGGRYVDRFERRAGRWAIAARVCIRDWAPVDQTPDMSDPSTLTAIRSTLSPDVVAFMSGSGLPRRDRTDPSYDRPLRISRNPWPAT
jgi:ketosteroid isomerase-like protein